MANFNRVILAGNLTRDPQLSMLPSNTPVCEFGMAINRKWKSQSGEMRDETCFVDLRMYGRRAEVLNQYLSKGRPLLVEGRLQYQQWEGKDGVKRSKHIVVVDDFEFIDGGQRGGGGGGAARSATSEGADEMPPPHEDVPNDSQIPF
jgi:single-strand DNA-binding protein